MHHRNGRRSILLALGIAVVLAGCGGTAPDDAGGRGGVRADGTRGETPTTPSDGSVSGGGHDGVDDSTLGTSVPGGPPAAGVTPRSNGTDARGRNGEAPASDGSVPRNPPVAPAGPPAGSDPTTTPTTSGESDSQPKTPKFPEYVTQCLGARGSVTSPIVIPDDQRSQFLPEIAPVLPEIAPVLPEIAPGAGRAPAFELTALRAGGSVAFCELGRSLGPNFHEGELLFAQGDLRVFLMPQSEYDALRAARPDLAMPPVAGGPFEGRAR